MKYLVFALVPMLWIGAAAQSDSIEKQALSAVQKMPASSLDAKLPNRPFGNWFTETVGAETSVVWQMAECGAVMTGPTGGRDLPACAEAAVILPNGNRVILAISVGTFKKGMSGAPAFFRGIIEDGEKLYQLRQLHELPDLVRSPEKLARLEARGRKALPSIGVELRQLVTTAVAPEPPPIASRPPEREAPMPVPEAPKVQKLSAGVLEGQVITKVAPVYPASARSVNAMGKVQVRIVISETGRVIEAVAISGHPALRTPAVEAARKWVYKPTLLNNVPVKVETVLTFTFANSQ